MAQSANKRERKMNSKLFLFFLPLLFACTGNDLYRAQADLDPNGWAATDPAILEFEVEEKDVDVPVNFFVDLRHNGEYPYRNLFLFMEMTLPNNSSHKDTVELLLADRLGHWRGSGGWALSNNVKHHVLYRYQDKLPMAGKYRVTVEQAMREDQLPGVLDVGVAISTAVK